MSNPQFSLDDFVENPTHRQLTNIRKVDWVTIANHYEIQITTSMRKEQLKNVVVESLVQQGVLEEQALFALTPAGFPDPGETSPLPKTPTVALDAEKLFELEKLRLEMEKSVRLAEVEKERERQQLEVDKEVRLAQIEAEEKRNLNELKLQTSKDEEAQRRREAEKKKIKPSEAAAQLPSFVEEDVDSYFRTFEKIATQNEWPRERWLAFLVPKFIGKAYKVYSSLDAETDYETVKSTILRAYSVTPDGYRQQFRKLRKRFDQTYSEFAQELKRLFKKWLDATQTTTFDELINLLVLEQFKSHLPFFILRYIEEQREKGVIEAAGLADAHHLMMQSLHGGESKKLVRTSSDGPNRQNDKQKYNSSQTTDSNFCTYCRKPGHTIKDCRHPNCKASKTLAAHAQSSGKPVLSVSTSTTPDRFSKYKRGGTVSLPKHDIKCPVTILRDTGAAVSLIQKHSVPGLEKAYTGEKMVVAALGSRLPCPVAEVHLDSPLYSGNIQLLVTDQPFEVPGVQLLLGNEPESSEVLLLPLVVDEPTETSETTDPEIFPICAVTRAQAQKQKLTSPAVPSVPSDNLYNQFISKAELVKAQATDPSLAKIRHVITDDSNSKVPYFMSQDGVVVRVYRPPELLPSDTWAETVQIVLPQSVREPVIKLAHDGMSGHLGVKKTYSKILDHFFWPGMHKQISQYIKSCHQCQVVGKPNQRIPQAPLIPITVPSEPFTKIVIDCVGPLPKTKRGNEYILTIMDPTTRYPEAIPLRNISAKTIVKHLLHLFTTFGLPAEIQSDRGTNFTSHLFEQIVKELNIHHVMSSAYRPQSQGCLERFHQTLKTMIKKFCLESDRDWDENIDWLMFAVRECPQESTGISPFQMLFGKKVRGPLKVLKDTIITTQAPNITVAKYIDKLRNTLESVRAIAAKNMKTAQESMIKHQKSPVHRTFAVGEKVLIFFPISGAPLKSKYSGPYVIQRKLSPTNYIIQTPDRRKQTQLVHINLLKKYVDRASGDASQQTILCIQAPKESTTLGNEASETPVEIPSPRGNPPNSEVLRDLPRYLELPEDDGVISLINQFPSITSDVPGSCNILAHDITLVDPNIKPIRQAPYRLNPHKAQIMEREVQYLLDHGLAEPSVSPWASPCILVPKADLSYRFCTDFRKVNNITVMDSFPLPLIDEILDSVGTAKYITTLDLNKGYWQIPLTDRAKTISSFITPQGLYSYTVLSFGLCNSAATFQRVINQVIRGLPGTAAYIDDLVVTAETREEHLARLRSLFERLAEAGLTLNLAKSKFTRGTVSYLGHIVGSGIVKPKTANIEAILHFPVPQSRRQVMQFLGMSGYYRRFCPNFSTVAAPLTALTSIKRRFEWTEDCRRAFEHLKAFLSAGPVLQAPDYNLPFHLYVDASGVGIGAVLLQRNKDTGVLHPTSYYSTKLKTYETSYSTIEKEALAIIKALKKYECYLLHHPEPITIYTDHNPLTFIQQTRLKNQRVMRWALCLQDFRFKIRHVKGVDNIIADCLSRSPC